MKIEFRPLVHDERHTVLELPTVTQCWDLNILNGLFEPFDSPGFKFEQTIKLLVPVVSRQVFRYAVLPY